MWAIMKKELKTYFFEPVGYIVIGVFLILFSAFFFLTSIVSSMIDLTALFYYTALYGLMFIIPLLTMWTIAGERKNGTDQLIMTAPVNMIEVVLAKFLSAMILILIPIICTLMYFGILSHYQMPDIPTYLIAALGFFLLSMAYVSFGIFASSLTESHIIAAILSFGIVFLSMWGPMFFGKDDFSLMNLFSNFLSGQLDITGIVMFVSLTLLSLSLTMIVMQRRKSVK